MGAPPAFPPDLQNQQLRTTSNLYFIASQSTSARPDGGGGEKRPAAGRVEPTHFSQRKWAGPAVGESESRFAIRQWQARFSGAVQPPFFDRTSGFVGSTFKELLIRRHRLPQGVSSAALSPAAWRVNTLSEFLVALNSYKTAAGDVLT